jgi:hypothetical protein
LYIDRVIAPPAWAGAPEQHQADRERGRQTENEALQKSRRLDGYRLLAFGQELEKGHCGQKETGPVPGSPDRFLCAEQMSE